MTKAFHGLRKLMNRTLCMQITYPLASLTKSSFTGSLRWSVTRLNICGSRRNRPKQTRLSLKRSCERIMPLNLRPGNNYQNWQENWTLENLPNHAEHVQTNLNIQKQLKRIQEQFAALSAKTSVTITTTTIMHSEHMT